MSAAAPSEPLPFTAADLVLEHSFRQPAHDFSDSFTSAAQHWGIKVTAETRDEEDGTEEVHDVGWSTATVLQNDYEENLYEVLDSIDGDHYTIGSTVFTTDGELAPALEDMLTEPIGDILICERMWIVPQFRGHDLGLVVSAMTIKALRRGCAFAVTYPAPFEGDPTDEERGRAIGRLGRHWSNVGFEHFQDGVWVLDLEAWIPEAVVWGRSDPLQVG